MAVSPEFRQQVESLYHSVLQIDPDKRQSFLDEMCGRDSSLRQEVESLLTEHDLGTIGSESARSDVATEILGGNPVTLIGRSISHYKILSFLGRGGMGEVYRAHDTKLGRNVALKLLPKSLHADEERLRRFAREARSASALNHPNVCVIHEIGETEDGQSFIAMEFIEGITLRQRLRQGPIQLLDAVGIALQIAAALIAAHKAGVVHRDIKPENIMLRPDGYVKVLDFGLAKLTEKYAFPSGSEAATFPVFDTQADHLVGTVYYLSPEQAKRRPIDERTDIWSLGVVLYEMLVGRMPFAGQTPSHAIVAILESEPEPLTNSLEGVPVTLESVVRKALKKDRSERYGTAVELATDLDSVKQELSTGSFETAKPAAKKRDSRFVAASAAVLLVILAGGVIYLLTRHKKAEAVPAAINSIAVLPFVNASSDPNVDYLSDGMTDSLIISLSQLPNLRVIGRNSAFRYRGVPTDTQTVGNDLGVQAILTGRIVEHDGNLSIYVDLEDVRDKHHIWGEQYNRKAADLLLIQDDISRKITEKLRLRLNGEEEQRLTKRSTDNPDAYLLYLKGRWFWNKFTKDGMQQAIASYLEAIKLDPNYGLAYAGIADVYVLDSTVPVRESSQRAKTAAEKALALDNSLGEAHATLGLIKTHFDLDWAGGEAEFKRAIELNPNYSTAHHYYGDLFTVRGDFDNALRELEKARELEPLSPIINVDIGLVYFYRGDYDRCIEHSKNVIQQFPDFYPAHTNLAWSYTKKQMYREAIAEYREALRLSNGHSYIKAMLAYTYAVSGKKDEALKILKDLQSLSKRQNVSPMRFAVVYLGLGEKEQLFKRLEQAREELDVFLIYIRVSPFFDSVRSDSRFQEFMQRSGLASQ